MTHRGDRRGFTLVELAVVIVILGVLAAFGMPRFINSVERTKAAGAFTYLTAVRASQERYRTRERSYATDPTKLDVPFDAMKHFTQSSMVATDDSWTMTLTRFGASAGYGAYTVTFNQDGYDSTNSSIDGYPAINPLGRGIPEARD